MAFGKKNHVSLNPLNYNIMLLGESGVGKTTLIKNFCEKLAGEDGYLFLEFKDERGADAIEGINYVNIPYWNENSCPALDIDEERQRMELDNEAFFDEVYTDIVENKTTEYPDLKVVVFDTYDQLITIAEEEAIRRWNKECRDKGNTDKMSNTINGAWGGFGKGEKKAMEIMTDVISQFRKVGVSTVIIGHVKKKDVSDVITGETYQVLTSDQQQNYFNHIKKNLHFLGLAYIDRNIIKEKTGKKNIVTNKEEIKGVVKNEVRKIKFRDEGYAVDSKSRFANIVPEIDLDVDEFINAITNAIKEEQKSSGKSIETTQKEEDEKEAKIQKLIKEKEQKVSESKIIKENVEKIVALIQQNKSTANFLVHAKNTLSSYSLSSFEDIKDVETSEKVLSALKQFEA